MNTTKLTLALALALSATAAGCAAQAPGANGGGDDGDGSGSGSGSDPGDGGSGGDDAPTPLSLDGSYTVTSTYDLATNMPGTAGDVVNQFIDATDDSDDPSRYIVDLLIAQLPDGTIKNYAQDAETLVVGYLNDELLSYAPSFVDTILEVGKDFGDVAKNFNTMDTFDIAGGQATHTITGVKFTIEGTDMEFAFADYGLTNVVAKNVATSIDATGKITMAAHDMPLSYGAVLRLALDQAIIPLIDPSATDLGSLFADYVDCASVGQYAADEIGIGTASTYESACKAGLKAAATLIYSQIDKISSSALNFGETGIAKGLDKDHDNKVDTIQTGTWSGTMTYATTPSTMTGAKFSGTRVVNPT